MATATTALSTGQFGQFPLYVFTGEGVFALSVGTGDIAYANSFFCDTGCIAIIQIPLFPLMMQLCFLRIQAEGPIRIDCKRYIVRHGRLSSYGSRQFAYN